jgi:O-antigen/teichoic acid export membrane protein
MSKFLSNLLKLFSATLVGQLLGFIVTPVLSRLYSPADFGIYQLFFSIVSLISIIACFSYHNAINLPKKDEDGAGIVLLCLFLITITSVVSLVFFFVFSGYIEYVLNAPGLSHYLFLVPLAVLCNSVAYVLVFWLSRKDDFGTIAKANLTSSFSGKGVSVASGMISPSPFGLIFGTIINDATIAIMAARRTLADFPLFKNISTEKIRNVAYRYKKFPKYNAISNFANTAGGSSTPFMLALFFTPAIVGFYALAYLVINVPTKLVGNALATVFFQRASVEKNLTGTVKNIVAAVHTRLISIGMFGCLVVVIIGPELFGLVLGDRWSTAGLYAQILTPWFFVMFISLPLLSIYNVLEQQQINLGFNILLLLSRIVVLYIGGILGDPVIGMILLSSTGVIFWSWMNLYTLKIAGVEVHGAMSEIIRYLVFGVLVCLPLILAKIFSVPSHFLILIAIILSAVYYPVIVYRDPELKEGIVIFVGHIGKNLHK